MVDTYCAKVAECAPATDGTDRGAECETALTLRQMCDRTVGLRGSMSDCLKALDAIDCGSFNPAKESPPWPDACSGLLVADR